jgi:hypothetical protein
MNGRGNLNADLPKMALAHLGTDKVRLADDREERQEKLRRLLMFGQWQ